MAVASELATRQLSRERPKSSAGALHSLPLALVMTAAVMAVPAGTAWTLLRTGLISSAMLCTAVAVALSLLATGVAMGLWARRAQGDAVLFSELLLWGWLRRWRCERQLADGVRLLTNLDGVRTGPLTLQALRRIANALEAQDPYLRGHSRRVARHVSQIAREMELPREEVRRIRAAAAMHDLGKLWLPAELLAKPGGLTEAEFELIKRHPVEGAKMAAGLGDRALTSIVRHHHERVDGRGYPAGLRADDIPVGARILAVADTFDAVTSARPYRGSKSHREALEILRAVAGTQLDEHAVNAFARCYAGRRAVLLWAAVTASLQRLVSVPSQAGAVGSTTGQAATMATSMLAACSLAVGLSAIGHRNIARDDGDVFHGASQLQTTAGFVPAASHSASAHARLSVGSVRATGRGTHRLRPGARSHRSGTGGAQSRPASPTGPGPGPAPHRTAGSAGSPAVGRPGAGGGGRSSPGGGGGGLSPPRTPGTPPPSSSAPPPSSGASPAPASPVSERPQSPGRSGSAPGQAGSTPGQSGAPPPGQVGATPGHSGRGH